MKNKKVQILVADPPYEFGDKLTMSSVKRGAESNYDGVLTKEDLINLKVKEIVDDNAVLVLWVPGSHLQTGLDIMKSWGFEQKQVWVWVKTKKNPLFKVYKELRSKVKNKSMGGGELTELILKSISKFSLSEALAFGMGRLFRQTHELALVGTRGKVYDMLANKSQRSVCFHSIGKHSEKPEDLQNMLDIMFPTAVKMEIFARKNRSKWTCVGNEAPDTFGVDIRDYLEKYII